MTAVPLQKTAAPFIPVNLMSRDLLSDRNRRLITPEMAKSILDNHRYARNRPIKNSKVHEYVELIKDGRWLPNSILRFVRIGSNVHLTNGQHRLTAVALAGIPVEFNVVVDVASNEAELDQIYAYADDIGTTRSLATQITAIRAEARLGLPAPVIVSASTAECYMRLGMPDGSDKNTKDTGKMRINVSERSEILIERSRYYADYIDAIKDAPGIRSVTLRKRVGILAAGSVMFQIDREKAIEFWEGLARDDGLSRADPRKALLIWMENAKAKTGASHFYPQTFDAAKAASIAWDSFRRTTRNELTQIRVGSAFARNLSVFDFVNRRYHGGNLAWNDDRNAPKGSDEDRAD